MNFWVNFYVSVLFMTKALYYLNIYLSFTNITFYGIIISIQKQIERTSRESWKENVSASVSHCK